MTQTSSSQKAVANWLLFGVFMLIVQILLGGITRLTGSGLSITEWDVVTGTLPPLNETRWMEEFAKYKGTPQYQLLNTDFTLSDFKFIFFWEWFHRLWARLMGMVFAVGFIAFISSYVFRILNIEGPQYWSVLKFVIGYSAAVFAIVQVLSSTLIRAGDKVMWTVSLLLLAPVALLLYCIVYKRVHGFYIHPSKV